ncbi:LysR substrate-binding domain-containing protein [Prauserella muralis]|uniref:LysR family transcriptional regulator n=1 Tax=Prauserella muralis TaxID=588067 RepID=A0A2V4AGG2_9PSEU|nr:LysR substrate-binding domain-containing protein [Prauserella muralis]PXY19018.1 LysR family transcriptional regulator [Prauserella muralis]
MELRQLRYFLTVAEEASFTRAAARLHVAQPGVSAQIRSLERELGQPLLDRSARAVRLTEAGAAVLPYARAALAAVEDVRTAVDELTGLLRGKVAVGMVAGSAALGVPEVLAAFHDAHPGVEVTLTEADTDPMLDALRAGRLDVAIAAFAGAAPDGIETRTLSDQPLVAAVGEGDPLAGRRGVTLAELGDRALIGMRPGTAMRAILDAACAAEGVAPRIAFEAGNPQVLGDLAARGLGVAILPESTARARPDLRVVPVTVPPMRGRVALAWRAEGPNGPAARAFIEHARARLATPPE